MEPESAMVLRNTSNTNALLAVYRLSVTLVFNRKGAGTDSVRTTQLNS